MAFYEALELTLGSLAIWNSRCILEFPKTGVCIITGEALVLTSPDVYIFVFFVQTCSIPLQLLMCKFELRAINYNKN